MPMRGLQDEPDRPRVTNQLDAEGGGREAACGVPAERRGRRAFLSESGKTGDVVVVVIIIIIIIILLGSKSVA